jgi:hypothetical protein
MNPGGILPAATQAQLAHGIGVFGKSVRYEIESLTLML